MVSEPCDFVTKAQEKNSETTVFRSKIEKPRKSQILKLAVCVISAPSKHHCSHPHRPQHRRPVLEEGFGSPNLWRPHNLPEICPDRKFRGVNGLHRWLGVRTAHVWPITHAARAQLILFFLSDALLAFVRLIEHSERRSLRHPLLSRNQNETTKG